jgi:WD40 repeat protein
LLTFSPDARTVAVSTNEGLFLFEVEGGKQSSRLPTAAGWGYQNLIAFSPDGNHLAGRAQVRSGGKIQDMVRIWNLANKSEPRDYFAENIIWLGWSNQGEPRAVSLEATGLSFHELIPVRSRHFASDNLPQPKLSAIAPCAGSRDGKTLFVASGDRSAVDVWDTTAGQKRHTLRPKGGTIYSVLVSGDGSKVATLTQRALQVWDPATGKPLYALEAGDKLRNPIFSPDGKLLAVLRSYDTIAFLDAATGKELGHTREKYFFAESFAISADGKTLAAAERYSGSLHFFAVPNGERKREPVGHGNRPFGTAFFPDGRRVATGGTQDGTIHVWDLANGRSLFQIRKSGRMVRNVAVSPDGRSLFSAWSDDTVWVSDAATGELRHTIKLEDPQRRDSRQSVWSMSMSGDGRQLTFLSYYYAMNGGAPQDTMLTGWDTATRKQLFRRRIPGLVSWTALSADARMMAVPYGDEAMERKGIVGGGPTRLEDVATGELLLNLPALPGQTWPQSFSTDGRLLAASQSNRGNKLRLFETATAGDLLSLPAAPNDRPTFSADGRLLALATPEREILLWDLAHGREWQRFKGFNAGVTWLAFSPDGLRLLSGMTDSTLLVWEVRPSEAGPADKLGEAGLKKAWADLAGADAPRAFQARWALASAPDEAIPFLKRRLRRAQPADPQVLRMLLADLGSDQFALRSKAQTELEKFGELAEPVLRETLVNNPTLEIRRRVQKMLERLRGPVTRPELLQPVRAVAVLEDIATLAAREILHKLASGAPEARLTRESAAALDRLDRRTPSRR